MDDDAVAHGSGSKEGLLTDELDVPAEVGYPNKSSGQQPKTSESVPQQSDIIPDGNDLTCTSGGQKSHNPCEIEPGHFDFLCHDEVSQVYSKQFPSNPSLSQGDSSRSSRGNNSTYSSSPSSSVRKLSLSKFMENWVEDTSEGPTPSHYDPPATEYSSPPRIRAPANLPLALYRPSPNRPVGSLLANFTWEEVVAMTVDSKYELGKGGFGSVYMGILSSTKRVAVKILDAASHQGDSEFLNEVNLLSRVNHVNLVKLLGFSQEGSKRALIYEYAEQGALWDHIHGKGFSKGVFLDWKTRLKIGLESACGLEYLHTGCTPRIIHRDIKSSNILLTKQLVAKVADFGLSKLGTDDGNQTHCSTMVKGTPGYLDPEYLRTCQLNEKSDVFSFGVVLLEIITGRRPIVQNSSNGSTVIGDWVKAQWKAGGMKGVVDPRLGEAYNAKAMKMVVTLALKCIEEHARNRPAMRIVVEQLRGATVLEYNTVKASKWSLKSLIMI